MSQGVTFRAAEPRDIDGIVQLINGFAAERVMLPRTPESVALALHDFIVAADAHGGVVACGSLKEYSPSLAEVASLAVARTAHAQGLGRQIVTRLESLARRRGIAELFALTLTPGFFEATGYVVTDRKRYPEKVRRDCAKCERRFACAEVCVSRLLSAEALAA
ncbi:MAG TPA: GNAT family N-acetyltransferase [Gemmatimonadaceae bacterium]|nr:GNAT family N-acetyltransferase [Gemmatimonadaceae bacterium]